MTGAAGPLGVAVPRPGVSLLPMDVELLCFIVLWCVIPVVPDPAGWFVVWALSPACKPVAELGGLFWANAVLETQSTAPIAHAIEKCFMPGFLSVRRETSMDRLIPNKRTLTCLLNAYSACDVPPPSRSLIHLPVSDADCR